MKTTQRRPKERPTKPPNHADPTKGPPNHADPKKGPPNHQITKSQAVAIKLEPILSYLSALALHKQKTAKTALAKKHTHTHTPKKKETPRREVKETTRREVKERPRREVK